MISPIERGLGVAAVAGCVGVLMLGCSPMAPSSQRANPTPSHFRAASFRPFMGAPEIPQPGWTKVTAGTSDHVCVAVGDGDHYRSGDFAASIGRGFVEDWRKHPGQAKLGWIPRDPTQGPLRIHGERDGGGRYDDDLGFAASYANATGYFWPDIPSFNEPGRWTFKLISGRDSGCFVVDL